MSFFVLNEDWRLNKLQGELKRFQDLLRLRFIVQMKSGNYSNLEAGPDQWDPLVLMNSVAVLTGIIAVNSFPFYLRNCEVLVEPKTINYERTSNSSC